MYLGERCHFSIRFLSACRDGDGEVAPVVATPCQGQSESSLHKGALWACGALGVAGLVHWVWLVWCIGRGWSGALGVTGLVYWAWLVWCIGCGWSGALGVAGLVLTCQSCSVRGSLCGGQTSSLCGFVHQITHPAEGCRVRGGEVEGWGGEVEAYASVCSAEMLLVCVAMHTIPRVK